MRYPLLTFAGLGMLTIIVFALFVIRLKPIEIPEPKTPDDVASVDEPSVSFVNPSRGPLDARVTIIEYGDFECEACRDVDEAVRAVQRLYPNDVRFVWKHMPNESIHPLATPASIAAMCAAEQNAFWAYYETLFDRQSFLVESQFVQIATDLGLNTDAFVSCFDARDTLPLVKRDFEEGLALGISATPTLFINNERYVGAITPEELVSYVQTALSN